MLKKSLVLCLVVFLVCVGMIAIAEEKQNKNESNIATLSAARNVCVDKVDGKSVWWEWKWKRKLKILPGPHTLELGFYRSGYEKSRKIWLKFYAKPKHDYYIRSNFLRIGDSASWRPEIIDTDELGEKFLKELDDYNKKPVVKKKEIRNVANFDISSGIEGPNLNYIINNTILKFKIDPNGFVMGTIPAATIGVRFKLDENSHYDAYSIDVKVKDDKFIVSNDKTIYIDGKEQKGVEFIHYINKNTYVLFLYKGSIIHVEGEELFIDEGKAFFYHKNTIGKKGIIDRRLLDKNGSFVTRENTYYVTKKGEVIPKEGIFEILNNKIKTKKDDKRFDKPHRSS